MGRLGMPQKRKKEVFTVDRVWDRKTEADGTLRYLTSWKGYSEKTWEPIEHFTQEAMELVRDLEAILDDPDNNPKPQWYLDFEELKARGVNVVKRTPGYNTHKAATSAASRSASMEPSSMKRERREDSMDSVASRRLSRARDPVSYSDVVRRRSRGGDSSTPTRVLPPRGAAAAAASSLASDAPGPSSSAPGEATAEASRNASRASMHQEFDRAESEEATTSAAAKEQKDEDEGPSSSSTMAADDVKEAVKEEVEEQALKVDVPVEMRAPLEISPPSVTSPSYRTTASPASTVLSDFQYDSAGILVPLEGCEHEVFDWAGHIQSEGGVPAPKECFWKRRSGMYNNLFENYIGRTLKVPDYDEYLSQEWCTVGTVKAVHGPWVQVHALDTDPILASWFMADDACLQEFFTLSDTTTPKCKEPNKRRSTGSYKRIVDRATFDSAGADNRVPREAFKYQLQWKHGPIENHFKVGYKMETYEPVRGDGCFYPVTVIEVNAAKDLVKYHFDGYPESHTKTVPYNDYRLFPCGFAAAIGWKCVLTQGMMKKSENRGRKKVSNAAQISPPNARSSPTSRRTPQPASRRTPQPSSLTRRTPQSPNNNVEKKRRSSELRKSDPGRATRPASYREQSTPDSDETEDEEEDRYVSRNPPHRTRAPAIPGLMKRPAEETNTKRVEFKTVENKIEEPPAKKPPRVLSPLRIEDFQDKPNGDTTLPITAFRYSHTGDEAVIFLNHDCNVGLNMHPASFKRLPSKSKGSLPHMWREILQQLLNCSVDSNQFANCLPKGHLGNNQIHMSITYDDTPNSMLALVVVPPPNRARAREIMASILKEAGMCPNSVCFDARRICEKCKNQEPSDNKVLDILRDARIQQQQLLAMQQFKQLHPAQQQAMVQKHHQQQLRKHQHHHQQHQKHAMPQPAVARVAPSTSSTPPVQQLLQPHPPRQLPALLPRPPHPPQAQPPPRLPHAPQQPTLAPRPPIPLHVPPIALPVALPVRPQPPHPQQKPPNPTPPPPRQPIEVDALDDPNRLMQKVNLQTLTESEIIEMLHALQIPEDVCEIFRRKKINWRSLQMLTEDIMVDQLQIPRQFATKIHEYIERNKGD